MLFKKLDPNSGKILHTTRPLLTTAQQGYLRPEEAGKDWWQTTTNIWNIDEIMRRRVRDWRRLLGETGHSGERTQTMRKDHDSAYTGTHSVFPVPLMECILMRYGGPAGNKVLDAFAGGPPRGVVSSIMGYKYLGVDIRQEQIDENVGVLGSLGLSGAEYRLADGCVMPTLDGHFDVAITCPPYFNLEVYSDLPNDLSNLANYREFNHSMEDCALAHKRLMRPGAFVCIVVGPFRDKKTGELIDFPGDTVVNFRKAGFIFWQSIILSKNFASAATRAGNAWKGHKLVPRYENLLVFRAPGG